MEKAVCYEMVYFYDFWPTLQSTLFSIIDSSMLRTCPDDPSSGLLLLFGVLFSISRANDEPFTIQSALDNDCKLVD